MGLFDINPNVNLDFGACKCSCFPSIILTTIIILCIPCAFFGLKFFAELELESQESTSTVATGVDGTNKQTNEITLQKIIGSHSQSDNIHFTSSHYIKRKS